jgi:hypothetical protein
LVGVVAVALIENWETIFTRSSPEPSPVIATTPAPVWSSPVPAAPIESLPPTPVPQPQAATDVNSPNPGTSVVVPPEQGLSPGFAGSPAGFSQETDMLLNKCTVTIDRPLVRLMSEASHFSPSVLEVRAGSYSATVYRLVSIGGGQIKEGWFQTQIEGRTGWINGDRISAKTNGCP